MNSSFSRSFSRAAAILLLALVGLGAAFQVLVKNFLTETTFSSLEQDARILSSLASSYVVDGTLTSRQFLLNLNVASQVSNMDAVVCNSSGTVVICSDQPLGCKHQGVFI